MISYRGILAALLLFTSTAAFAGPAEEANTVVDGWSAAYDANDAVRIAEVYTPDAILLGTVSPVISEGTAAIVNYHIACPSYRNASGCPNYSRRSEPLSTGRR